MPDGRHHEPAQEAAQAGPAHRPRGSCRPARTTTCCSTSRCAGSPCGCGAAATACCGAWVLVYRSRGKGRRYQIGRADVLSPVQARKAAKDLLATITLGRRPRRPAGGRAAPAQRRDRRLPGAQAVAGRGRQAPDDRPRCSRPSATSPCRCTWGGWAASRSTASPARTSPATSCGSSGPAARPRPPARRRALSSAFSWAMSTGMAEFEPDHRQPTSPSSPRPGSACSPTTSWSASGRPSRATATSPSSCAC